MKTKKILWIGLGLLLMWDLAYGLTINQVIDNAISYMKKMIFTIDGTDNTKSTVIVDWTKGNVSMSWDLVVEKDAKIGNQLTASWLNVENGISTKDLNVGNNAIINWNVWIWTTNPKAKLHILESVSESAAPVTEKNWLYITKSWLNEDISVDLGIDTLWNAWLELKGKKIWYIDFWTSSNIDYNGRISYNRHNSWFEFIGNSFSFETWNVWIWTTNPHTHLEIKIDSSKKNNMWILIEGTGNDYASPRLGLVDTRLGSVDKAPAWYIDNNAGTFRIFRQPNINTAGSQPMFRITSGWNVWIWTTDPKVKLDVNGDIQSKWDIKVWYINPKNTWTFPWYWNFLRFYWWPAWSVRNSDNSDPTWIARYNVSTDHTELRINVGDNDGGDDAVNITSESGEKSLMYIKNNWNVWIWTTNPQTHLEIKIDSSKKNNMWILIEGTGNDYASPRLGLVDTRLGSVDKAPAWYIDNNADTFRIFRQPNINTAGSQPMFRITSGWNVWIWTTDPQAKLDVNGKIISNYIDVKPQNTDKEWWEIKLQKSNSNYSDAYLDNYEDKFRVHSNGTTKFQVNLKDGSTTIAGNTKINWDIETDGNITVWKNIIMKDGRQILYKDEAAKLYAVKNSNLPFTVIWEAWDYLKPDIKWDFKSPIVKWNQYFLEEANGRVIWLRVWFDGKKYWLFYSYLDQTKGVFVDTDIQYQLDNFKVNGEYPCKIIGQTEDSVTIKTCITNAQWISEEKDTYFIITNWDTLNPVENNKHIKKLPSWVPTANGYSSKLYYFASIDKIAYLEMRNDNRKWNIEFRVFNGDGTEIDYTNDLTNDNTRTIFKYDAPDQDDGEWCTTWTYLIMCNHTTYGGIQRWDPYAFYVALDSSWDLIIQNTRSYRERRWRDNHKTWQFTANIKTRFSFKDKKLYYLNQMPLKFDVNDPNANISNWIGWYYPDRWRYYLIRRKSYDISYLKRSKKVLMSVSGTYPSYPKDPGYKVRINTDVTPAEFIYNNDNLWDIWPENKQGYEKNYHSIPYDASWLWKWLSKTYFVGKNKIYSYAYSYTYTPEGGDWKFRHTISTLPDLEIVNNSLKIPTTTELVDTSRMDFYAHRYDSMYLDDNWNIRIIYVENNQLKVYKEELNNWNWWVEVLGNISETYYDDTLNNIKNEPSIKELLNDGYSLYRYRIKPLIKHGNDIYFLWLFVLWKPNGNKNTYWAELWTSKVYFKLFKYNTDWTLSAYNASTLYLEQDDKWLIWNRDRWLKMVSYMTSDASKLMFYYVWMERSRTSGRWDFDYSIVYDMANKSIVTKKDTNRRNYRRSTDFRLVGIHPEYGPYYTSAPWEAQYIYYYPMTWSTLDERMEDAFKNLNFDSSSDSWIQPRHKVLWVTPARWFIIYTSASKISSNWITDVLQTKSYNLPEVLGVSENDIKNKTIYAYPNPDNITELKFDLEKDPNKTYIITIQTSDIWIASVNLLDGMSIDTEQVIVNNIFVGWAIKMIDRKTWKTVLITVEDWQIVIQEQQ